MHAVIEIAAALVFELNNGPFVADFTAVRSYRPVYELKDAVATLVTVVPRSCEISTATRGAAGHQVAIDIAIQRRPEIADDASFDELMTLVDRVVAYLRGRRLEDAPDAVFVAIANEPVFVQEHVDQWGQFTSVVTVTYRVAR